MERLLDECGRFLYLLEEFFKELFSLFAFNWKLQTEVVGQGRIDVLIDVAFDQIVDGEGALAG